MASTIDLLRMIVVDLRRITSEARLLMVDRPAPTDVDQLRDLRGQLVENFARFQQLVHCVLMEALGKDARSMQCAVELKIGAINLDRAYAEFRARWLERRLHSNWPEYRLSAQRMIHTIYGTMALVDMLSSLEDNEQLDHPRTSARAISGR